MLKKLGLLPAVILLCLMAGCIGQSEEVLSTPETQTEAVATEMRMITDMAGREVEIPARVESVYSTGQPGVVMMYTLCPDKLLGWCIEPSNEEKQYINPKYLTLPVLGLMQGSNNTANREEIMGRGPDIVILVTEITEDSITDAEEIQFTMNIPVVMIDYSLEKLGDSYGFLGELIDEQQRAAVLGDYCVQAIKEAKTTAASIPADEKLTVYYAQGSKGLQTAPLGSSHSEVVDLVGGVNIVTLEAETDGRLTVNMEQILVWDPDVIIASNSMNHTGTDMDGSGFFSIVKNASETWSLVKAVKEDMVFSVPCLPYNWLDMPPSANRIIGIKWLGALLYPDYYDYDMESEIAEFYSLFYNKELTEAQMDYLLINATR